MPIPPTSAKPTSHAPWGPSASFSSRNGPVVPPKTPPPPPPPGPPAAPAGTAGLTGEAAEAVVAEDERPDRVVVGARDVRAVGRGREGHEQRPDPADDDQRGEAREQLAQRREVAAGGDPQVRGGQRGHHEQRGAHLRLEPEPDHRAGEDEPARAPVLQRADDGPERHDGAQQDDGVRVVVPEDRDGRRRDGERETGDEAADAAEAAARQVPGEPDGGDAHDRLGHEDRPRGQAEGARGQRLHPQRERRLVHRHDAGWIEGAEEEVVPALRHRADGCAVVVVRPAVRVERPEVQGGGQREQQEQLRAGDGTAQQAGTALLALRRDGLGDGTGESGGGRRVGRRTTLEPEVHAGRIGTAPQPRSRGT